MSSFNHYHIVEALQNGLPRVIPSETNQALGFDLCKKEPQYAKAQHWMDNCYQAAVTNPREKLKNIWPVQHGTKDLCTNIDAR